MSGVRRLGASALLVILAASGAGAWIVEDVPYRPAVSENKDFQRGMTYFPVDRMLAPGSKQYENIDRMLATGTEWVALVPVWYQRNKRSTLIAPDPDETASDRCVRTAIRYLHEKGARVMLKPYVDSGDGTWRANFEPTSTAAWFNSYRRFMNHYADMAAEEGVELLCVGCEYKWCDADEYDYWEVVIDAVRSRYDGELTYAAHWKNYRDVCLWNLVDYVGVNTYFPLSDEDDVSLSALVKTWDYQLGRIGGWRRDARLTDKQVILTEVGYQSRPACWKTPGLTMDERADAKAQDICYKALLMTAPGRSWLRGIYIWCWDNWSPNSGGAKDNTWTPKGKPAETVLSDSYKSY
ncbi:MAG TPA: hypothetical protein VMW93_07530 [bacterium]|nr:hypothetical protein [bacterium]